MRQTIKNYLLGEVGKVMHIRPLAALLIHGAEPGTLMILLMLTLLSEYPLIVTGVLHHFHFL